MLDGERRQGPAPTEDGELVRRVHSDDCRTLPFSASEVFNAILDFQRYPEWWPKQLRIRVLRTTTDFLGSQIEVRPMGGRFTCEVVGIERNRIIQIAYVDGLHRGVGVWKFEADGDGTAVSYRIDLEPQGWLPRLLSHVMDFGRIHSNEMQQVFDGMEKWLKGQRSSRVSSSEA